MSNYSIHPSKEEILRKFEELDTQESVLPETNEQGVPQSGWVLSSSKHYKDEFKLLGKVLNKNCKTDGAMTTRRYQIKFEDGFNYNIVIYSITEQEKILLHYYWTKDNLWVPDQNVKGNGSILMEYNPTTKTRIMKKIEELENDIKESSSPETNDKGVPMSGWILTRSNNVQDEIKMLGKIKHVSNKTDGQLSTRSYRLKCEDGYNYNIRRYNVLEHEELKEKTLIHYYWTHNKAIISDEEVKVEKMVDLRCYRHTNKEVVEMCRTSDLPASMLAKQLRLQHGQMPSHYRPSRSAIRNIRYRGRQKLNYKPKHFENTEGFLAEKDDDILRVSETNDEEQLVEVLPNNLSSQVAYDSGSILANGDPIQVDETSPEDTDIHHQVISYTRKTMKNTPRQTQILVSTPKMDSEHVRRFTSCIIESGQPPDMLLVPGKGQSVLCYSLLLSLHSPFLASLLVTISNTPVVLSLPSVGQQDLQLLVEAVEAPDLDKLSRDNQAASLLGVGMFGETNADDCYIVIPPAGVTSDNSSLGDELVKLKEISGRSGIEDHINCNTKDKIEEEDTYYCDQCCYKSDEKSNLLSHKRRTHSTVKVICDQCGAEFNNRDGLGKHKVRKHKGIKLICDVCPLQFDEKLGLMKHRRNVHGKSYDHDYGKFHELLPSTKVENQHHISTEHKDVKYHWKPSGYQAEFLGIIKTHKPEKNVEIRLLKNP